jgi:hypothetical protein
MNIHRDYNGQWRIEGYESLPFSTEADAANAAELMHQHAARCVGEQMLREMRHRSAAKAAETAHEGS